VNSSNDAFLDTITFCHRSPSSGPVLQTGLSRELFHSVFFSLDSAIFLFYRPFPSYPTGEWVPFSTITRLLLNFIYQAFFPLNVLHVPPGVETPPLPPTSCNRTSLFFLFFSRFFPPLIKVVSRAPIPFTWLVPPPLSRGYFSVSGVSTSWCSPPELLPP